jgi:monoamine oxidase
VGQFESGAGGEPSPYGHTRRSFIHSLASMGGTALAVAGMEALGFGFASAQTGPPALTQGKTAKVVILGAGLAGMTAAYELGKMGYDVQILEARATAGGRSQTARKGWVNEEVTGSRQVCEFDEGQYMNMGPWRIPWHHTATLHYVREFNVPLEIVVNDNDAAYVMMKSGKGPLSGKRIRKGELTQDMRGYEAELLAKTVRQGALDAQLTAEDRELFIQYLIRDGSLNSKSLNYDGTVDAGLHAQPVARAYSVRPGAGVSPGPGVTLPPYPLKDILTANAWKAVVNAAVWEHPQTMFQAVGGMDMITKGFERHVGPKIKFQAVVQKISQAPNGVRVAYKDASGATTEIAADYCICTIPLSVLNGIPTEISAPFKAAMQKCAYAPVNKIGLQMKSRFWETKHEIFGGHVWTDKPGVNYISLPSTGWYGKKGVILGYYTVNPADAARISALSPANRIKFALEAGTEIFPEYTSEFDNGVSKSWHLDRYNLGGWASWSEEGRQEAYPVLCEPDGRIYLSGEHLSYLGGWQAGAIESAWQQIAKLHARVQQA